jgi:hypothetical protein
MNEYGKLEEKTMNILIVNMSGVFLSWILIKSLIFYKLTTIEPTLLNTLGVWMIISFIISVLFRLLGIIK